MGYIAKVVIYLVHRGHLLMFEHPDAPEAGLQVPAGTVQAGEELLVAAHRELLEETGIHAFSVRLLGTAE
jgi:8-oxo-dGTP pyrophosphatase MutT (NUDIX family)